MNRKINAKQTFPQTDARAVIFEERKGPICSFSTNPNSLKDNTVQRPSGRFSQH
jgi:hypothetical protein